MVAEIDRKYGVHAVCDVCGSPLAAMTVSARAGVGSTYMYGQECRHRVVIEVDACDRCEPHVLRWLCDVYGAANGEPNGLSTGDEKV